MSVILNERAARAAKIDEEMLTPAVKYAAMFFAGWLAHSYVDRTADHAKHVLPAVLSQAECEKREALATDVVTAKQLEKDCHPVTVEPELKKP